MEYRLLGRSGLKVSALTFGNATFGGRGELFQAMGSTDAREARRLVDICLDAGVNMFDTSDMHSGGLADQILAEALGVRRHEVLIATKAGFPTGPGPNDVGASRYHLISSVENSLRRFDTDRIDLLQMHGFDAMTPLDETLGTLDDLVRAGKVRYIGCSNYSGWHLMKALGISERYGWSRFVTHQAYYSLIGRDYEWELLPLALDQGVGTMAWSPLGFARLTGKIRRDTPLPAVSRLHTAAGPKVPDDYLYGVVDVLDEISAETGRSIPQISINWLLDRPTVCTAVIGARNEEQLRDNLGAVGWSLSEEQVERLDAVSERTLPYPYWHQRGFDRNPFPTLPVKELMGLRDGRTAQATTSPRS
jgi:aryl-alcohol dehydrogenase-like predicted oxidoreductase